MPDRFPYPALLPIEQLLWNQPRLGENRQHRGRVLRVGTTHYAQCDYCQRWQRQGRRYTYTFDRRQVYCCKSCFTQAVPWWQERS